MKGTEMNHQNTAAEAKYSKFLDHPNGSVAYTVLHPSLSENQLDLEVRRAYIQGHSCWVCAEPSGAFRAVASTRKGAVELSLKQVALYLEGKQAEGNECDICHEFFAESLTDRLCQKCLVLVEAEEADNAAYLEDWKERTGCLDAPVKGAWMREPDNTYAYYEVVAVAADGQSCQVWHHGPILTVTLKRDGLWWFNETPVAFYSKRALV